MRNINTDKDNYIKPLSSPEDKPLQQVKTSLREDEAHMQISPIEGKMLHTFVKMVGARKIV